MPSPWEKIRVLAVAMMVAALKVDVEPEGNLMLYSRLIFEWLKPPPDSHKRA